MPNLQDVPVNGPWTRGEVRSFLSEAIIPARLSVLNGEGWPLVLSLWFMPDEDALWCATNEGALVVRHLRGDDRCAFEIAGDTPPYRGIRGQARASLHPQQGAAVLEALLERYSIQPGSRLSRMLLARADTEVAIRLEPKWISSWDFSERMQGATAPPQR